MEHGELRMMHGANRIIREPPDHGAWSMEHGIHRGEPHGARRIEHRAIRATRGDPYGAWRIKHGATKTTRGDNGGLGAAVQEFPKYLSAVKG